MTKHFKDIFIDKHTGEIICNCGCGNVLEENLPDQSQNDSLSKNPEKRLTETHHQTINSIQHDGGLGTEIKKVEYTFNNKRMFFPNFAKLQKYARSTGSTDRRLIKYITVISKILDENNFSNALLVHCIYYLRKCEKKSLLNNKRTTLASMCIIYLTTKQIPGFDYRIKKDMKRNNIKYGTFMQYTREFEPVFNSKIKKQSLDTTKSIILERLCDKIYLSMKLRLKARSILQYCTAKSLFPTISSQVWATTCIWLAIRNNENYTNHNHIQIYDLAKSAGVTVEAIGHLKRKLLTNGTLHLLSLSKGIIKNIANMYWS